MRASRHLLLPGMGLEGQRRLRNARVCVVGAGGLGAPVLQYLAAAGVGTLGIVDDDVVDLTNLQRQVIHGTSDVGRPKVDSARDAVLELDPTIVVRTHPVRLSSSNAAVLLGEYDLVVDGTDNFPTRYLVSDACAALGLPVVWGSVLRFDAQVSVFWALAGVTLRDLFPDEPAPGDVPSCSEAGVVGALCGQVGSLMATEAIKLITGLGRPLLGRVLALDALNSTWTPLPLTPLPTPHPLPPTSAEFVGESPVRRESPTTSTISDDLGEGAGVQGVRVQGVGVPEVGVGELEGVLVGGAMLVDVREAHEVAAARIPGGVLAPLDTVLDGSALEALPRDRPVVVYCHSGVRSQAAAQVMRAAGIDAANLSGGIAAWLAHNAR